MMVVAMCTSDLLLSFFFSYGFLEDERKRIIWTLAGYSKRKKKYRTVGQNIKATWNNSKKKTTATATRNKEK